MIRIDTDGGAGTGNRTSKRRILDRRWLLLAGLVSGAAVGQTAGVQRQPLETATFPGKGLHTTMVRTTLDANSRIAPHRHPGLEVAYVATGRVEVTIGAAPKRLVAAGQSFQITPGLRHAVDNAAERPR